MEPAEEFRAFADSELAPHASRWDNDGAIGDDVPALLAKQGWLAPTIPAEHGGAGLTETACGALCEAIATACSSTRSLVTVQTMVAAALLRWGTAEQRARWLPTLASGSAVAGFCLTEPDVGSDAASVRAQIVVDGDTATVSGDKRWITFGQRADVYLVIATSDGAGATAVLVERTTPGVSVTPVSGQLGLRAAQLADVRFDACRVPATNVVGRPGTGFTHVATTALDSGRHTVAWGCVGIGQACMEASYAYAGERQQFGVALKDHQLVRRMLSDMLVDVRAARLLCRAASQARDDRSTKAMADTIVAKYAAARMASSVAADAVQVHGANGVGGMHAVERHLRDAKVMQIIEGTDQMHQLTIAEYGSRELGRRRP